LSFTAAPTPLHGRAGAGEHPLQVRDCCDPRAARTEKHAMTPRTWAYGDVEGEDLPVRDRPYETSFGQQGLALPTYGEEPTAVRGEERLDLGEPVSSRGPKGWQRRDDRIHDDVCAHLTDDSYVDASDLEVIVHQGEVILSGTVRDREQRERAIHIAESVRGVVDVVPRLRVARAEQGDEQGDAPRSER
jgi:hypothetical protein